MRKLSASLVIAMALLGLLGFSSQAQAQNEPLVLDNVMAWWDHLNCQKMINAVNAIDGLDTDHAVLTGEETFSAGTDGDNDSEREWCAKWADLGANQQRALNAGAKQSRTDGGIVTSASDRVFDMSGWWDGRTLEGQNMAVGGTATAVVLTDAANTSLTGNIRAAYMSLMGDAMPAPAIPLVGLGLLGFLVAGRGAYLRRRAR